MSRNGSKAGLNESNRASRAHGISFEEKELTRLKDSSNLSSQKSISKGIYDKEDQLKFLETVLRLQRFVRKCLVKKNKRLPLRIDKARKLN